MENHTAVQWLVEQYLKRKGFLKTSDIEKALEMEKEQMKDAYHEDRPFLWGYETGEFFEQYYNTTFKSE